MNIDLTNKSSYREAELLIEDAYQTNATHLSLNSLRITDLPTTLNKLNHLESLDLSECYWLADITVLSNLYALRILNFSRCTVLPDLTPLEKLTALQSLDISGCGKIADLAPLGKLTALKSLDIAWCYQLTDLTPLKNLTALQSLDLSGDGNITDLAPLGKLTALQSLELSWCGKITDIAPLGKLTALQSLEFSWCEGITDIAPLEKLTALQSLNLFRCENITDIATLEKLTTLQSLNISGQKEFTGFAHLEKLTALKSLDLSGCNRLTDLTPLKNLTALKSLNLSGCEGITDIAPLEKLTALQSLDISEREKLTDLAPLGKLTALQSLELSGCEGITDIAPLGKLTALKSLDLSWCGKFTDIAPLGKLTALQSLDLSGCEGITGLAPLEKLTALQSLEFSWCEGITDIAPLEKLTALQSLDFSGCGKITDIAPLENLTALQILEMHRCKPSELTVLAALTSLKRLNLGNTASLSAHLTDTIKNLRHLSSLIINVIEDSSLIFGFPRLVSIWSFDQVLRIKNVPAELLDETRHQNALEVIIPWQKDIIATGPVPNTELKLFILGNGRVGKTQISRRLQHLVYNPEIPSTHGITLNRYKVLDKEDKQPEIHLNLWDFGGQDVYLGTHGLFLDDRAIYVLAWHPDHENDREFFENGVPMRNRPLAYWLAYIRSLAGSDAPIIIVQTQCDEGDEEVAPPLPIKHDFNHLKITACSARADYGIERLSPVIRAAARQLRKRYAAVQIPQSWVEAESTLRKRRNEGQKTFLYDDFVTLCKDRNPQAHPNTIANFLHRAGQVFWREGAFGNDLVLKQEWALEGIYALLERNEILPMIRDSHGIFNLAQLERKVWKDYGKDEQKLFLDMMTQCGICFSLGNETYVAADLLPSERTMKKEIEDVWRNAEPDALVELHYEFLHDGVIKNILCQIGQRAGKRCVYWRTGLCYYDRDSKSAVQIRAIWKEGQSVTQHGRIELWVEGPNANRLARHLVRSIESIRIGSISQVLWRRGKKEVDKRKLEEDGIAQAPFSGISPEANEQPGEEGNKRHATMPSISSLQNILLLATEWESLHGGLSTFNRELCIALARMGKTVCCAVPQASSQEIEQAREKDIQLVSTGSTSLQRKLQLGDNFTPDIIIGHGRITGEAAKIQHEDQFPNAKRIHFIHMAPGQIEWHKGKEDAAQQARDRECQELELAKDAYLVAAVGPLLYREASTLIERLPANERPKITQFNPGFDRIETRTTPSSLHCLLVGRAEDEALKGIDIAAQALQQIDVDQLQHTPELIIRGAPEGTGTKLYKDLITRFNGLSVRIREYSSNADEIIGDYRCSALTLMPSRCEGFGLVALESLSIGTPVLISDKSGLAELLTTILEPHEQHHYIVKTPDDCSEAARNWKEKIFIQLSDIEAAIHRANKLCDILDEQLTWTKSCENLLKKLL